MASGMLDEMFSDATTPRERGDRFEALKSAFGESIKRHDSKVDAFDRAGKRIVKGAGSGAPKRAGVEELSRLAERFSSLSKDVGGVDEASIQADLAALNALKDSLGKDLTTTVPGNLHPYDLEAPAKQLVPRFTPLRNDIPRQKGQGTAREFRRILGYTNTGMGGVPDQTPFFNSETALNGGSTSGLPNFGALSLIRGQKIAYSMDVHSLPYMEMSLSASTAWKAQFANMGFEDSRALDQMALLWGHLLGEEKAILWGRGSSSLGYSGAVASPTGYTVAASGTGSSLAAAEYYVKLTSYTGMGQSIPGAEANTGATITAGENLVITVPTAVAGALSYGVYVGTASGAETFQGFFIPAAGAHTITLSSYATGGVAASTLTADGSYNANAYDGIITTLLSGGSAFGPGTAIGAAGYISNFATANVAGSSVYTLGGSTNVGDKPFQDMWASLYASVYADPEELWMTAVQRRQLADYLRNQPNGGGAYRINMQDSSFSGSGVEIGGFVSGIANQSSPSNRIVDLRVHPYMPTGVAFTRQRHLPIPDSGISDTSVITEVQGYMSVDWPEVQFTYDSSTYWYGTLVHYAPAWSGIITNLQ